MTAPGGKAPGRLILSENAYFFGGGRPPDHPAVERVVFTPGV
jgi:hypothetical protein